jgi:L-arabinose 1-dehydrogenase [NAD(P)+]
LIGTSSFMNDRQGRVDKVFPVMSEHPGTLGGRRLRPVDRVTTGRTELCRGRHPCDRDVFSPGRRGDAMAIVTVTGAGGSIGREALDALEDHEVRPLTHSPTEGIDDTTIELADIETLHAPFRGADVVVHLAGDPSPSADWDSVLTANIHGTHNVFEAAARAGVERVVFASTNHVVQSYNARGVEGNDKYALVDRPRAIEGGESPRPDSYYGVSKVAGEALGSYYADRHGMDVVNLRIGWTLDRAALRERAEGEMGAYAMAQWLSWRDCRDGLSSAVEAELPHSPLTVNLVSRNTDRYLSIEETTLGIGYTPRDDSSDVV